MYWAEPVAPGSDAAIALFRSLGAAEPAPVAPQAEDLCSGDPARADTALCEDVWEQSGMDDGLTGDGYFAAEEDNTCLIRMLGCRLEGSAAVRFPRAPGRVYVAHQFSAISNGRQTCLHSASSRFIQSNTPAGPTPRCRFRSPSRSHFLLAFPSPPVR